MSCLCLLERANILKILFEKGHFQINLIKELKNPGLIKAAIISLLGANILYYENENYFFQNLVDIL